jgi:hypothetical protein
LAAAKTEARNGKREMVSVPSKRKIKDPGERYVNRESLVYMKKLLRDQDPVARGKKIHERTGTEAKHERENGDPPAANKNRTRGPKPAVHTARK